MTKEEIIQKLVTDLEVRGRNATTVKDYRYKVGAYQDHFDKPADEMSEEEIRIFLHHLLTVKKLSQSSVNVYNSAIRFVYLVTLDRQINIRKIPRLKQIRSIPDIFTKEEIRLILDSADTLQHKAMLMLAYGSGLRLSEITHLKVSDIDSKQMRIFVRKGKGDRDRFALLPESTLLVLREYWRELRPADWLFINRKTRKQVSDRMPQEAFERALKKSGIRKKASIHTLRHCFATHLYESGKDLLAMKKLLGHVRIDTTAWYTQLADSDVLKLESPIDTLPKKRGRPRKVTAHA